MSIVLGMHRIIEYYIGVRHEHVAYSRDWWGLVDLPGGPTWGTYLGTWGTYLGDHGALLDRPQVGHQPGHQSGQPRRI